MISQDQADALARQWVAAWNAHDLDGILAHYAEDVEFISPFVVRLLEESTGTVIGKSGLRDYFQRGLARYPALRFELYCVFPGVQSVTLYYQSVNRLFAAEVMELDANGKIKRVMAHYTEK